MSKYGNTKVVLDGITFDSKKEANRWAELKLLERAKQITFLERQVPYVLIPAQRDLNGKLLERECRYIADFVYTENGKVVVEDTKSKATRTPEYIIKRKLMLERYGVRVKEV